MDIYNDGQLRRIGILERPCPMVHGVLVDHGHRNRSTERWREVFSLAKEMVFDTFEAGFPGTVFGSTGIRLTGRNLTRSLHTPRRSG